MEHDAFTKSWYTTFLDTIPAEQTAQEVALIEQFLPSEVFPKLFDLACGPARHSELLASKGYAVYGIDKDVGAIERAKNKQIPRAIFKAMDMRETFKLNQEFDGVINLWHSFGYYDAATNASILQDVANTLRPRGRAVFDIYNRDHMRTLPEREVSTRNDIEITTIRTWDDDRLRCEIHYDSAPVDVLEWQLYSPDEFAQIAQASGLAELMRCAWFDESLSPSAEHARMQFVFERPQT